MPTGLDEHDPPEVGGYRLLSRLGAGGMGVVYLATTAGGPPVALKVLHAGGDADGRVRFRHEVEASLRVASPYTAKVLDADVSADRPFLVTEYVPGERVDEHVRRHGPLQGERLVAFAAATALGLDAIHAAGITHRDITPGNVILSPDGPKIIDLGIALVESATRLTRTGTTVGTPGFLSPEQARGGRVGPASDVFSWGAVVAYAGTGRAPFGAGATDAVVYRVVHEEADIEGLSPPSVRSSVLAALDKDPGRRPAAAEVAGTLADTPDGVDAHDQVTALVRTAELGAPALPDTPAGGTVPMGTRPAGNDLHETVPNVAVAPRPSSRWRWVAVAATLMALAAVAVTAMVVSSPRRGQDSAAVSAQSPSGRPTSEPDDGVDTPSDDGKPTESPAPDPTTETDAERTELATTQEPAPGPPVPRAPAPPWGGAATAPSGGALTQAASWWSEWMNPACHLYWPVGVEDELGVEVEGPVETRIGDVQMLFRQPPGEQGPELSVVVWPADHPYVGDLYAQHPEPDMTWADGSELRSLDTAPGSDWERLLSLAGNDCFYQVSANSMASLGWAVEGLRRIDVG